MESQPQNPEIRNDPENFHPRGYSSRLGSDCHVSLKKTTLCMLGGFLCSSVIC